MRIHQYFKIIKVDYADSEYLRLHNETNDTGTFTCTRVGTTINTPNLEYSTDGVNWTTADMSATWSVTVGPRGNIYLRGNNGTRGFNASVYTYYTFSMDVDHSAHGNVMSIQNYTTMATVTAIPDYCFTRLFSGDAKLIDVSGMNFGNVTSIGVYGCTSMLSSCSALTTALDFSNVTSVADSGCNAVFDGCSKIQTVYAPNITEWDTLYFYYWVNGAGTSAATPKIMYFKTQELMDSCPSGINGYGAYTKTLL